VTGYDAIVVGSGPNGLAAAITLAGVGRSVLVLEGAETPGGGCRSAELTLPGFVHDVCSAVHPLGKSSPVFAEWPLAEHGLEWVHPEVPMAHPLDDGSAAAVYRSVEETAEGMGVDARPWRRLVGRLARHWDVYSDLWLSPLLRVPRHPLHLARSGPWLMQPARTLSRLAFKGDHAPAAIAGFAAHSILPLDHVFTGGAGLVFNAAAHAVGMPLARGGSQSIADALTSYLRSLGGQVVTGQRVASLADIPPAKAVLFDLTPRQVLDIAGDQLKPRVRRSFKRYRYGNGSYKVDYALDGPVPWKADACRQAGTVHVGGTIDQVAASERAVANGEHPDQPFVLVSQPTLADPGRAPDGKCVVWAYCHVPAGSTVDMADRIDAQIERFAPGFRDLVLARSTMPPAELERHNPNYIGGDIAGGYTGWPQTFFRPRFALDPWTIGKGLYLCSQSTPPGVGVHGMCGWYAAQKALRHLPRQ
jgi:phytoene dehydrogenase-like protein